MNGKQRSGPGPGLRRSDRGAALLVAMLTVTLVASLAAAALWQQWRAIEVESAERGRVQAAWLLVGALDWSRLLLREDGRANGIDHLAEPWAVPLQEARLSSFLAAERNVTQVQDASSDARDAFLSGDISDLQARLNVSNLVLGASPAQAQALRQFGRLFERLGLPAQQLRLLADALRQAQTGSADGERGAAPLMPPTSAQLGWLGLSPATESALAPYVTLLPARTAVNLNTAGVEVLLAAVEGLDQAGAQKIVQAREARHFSDFNQVRALLGDGVKIDQGEHDLASSYFEVRGRLRLDDLLVDEHSLVHRQGSQVSTLWRQRGAAPERDAAPGAAIQ